MPSGSRMKRSVLCAKSWMATIRATSWGEDPLLHRPRALGSIVLPSSCLSTESLGLVLLFLLPHNLLFCFCHRTKHFYFPFVLFTNTQRLNTHFTIPLHWNPIPWIFYAYLCYVSQIGTPFWAQGKAIYKAHGESPPRWQGLWYPCPTSWERPDCWRAGGLSSQPRYWSQHPCSNILWMGGVGLGPSSHVHC